METDEIKADLDVGKADKPVDKPLSKVDEAKKVLEDTQKATLELKEENDRRDKMKADELLSGSAGGHVEPKLVSPEDKKVEQAKEFFKGSALGDAITKANE